MRIRPPYLAALYLLAAFGLDYLFPGMEIVRAPIHFLGLAIFGAGLLIAVWALLLFRRKETPHHPFATPKALVTTGPFGFSRSPMYLGVSSVLLGIAVLVGTAPMFLAPLAFSLTMNATFIPREERTLERLFGREYLEYKRRVRRWL